MANHIATKGILFITTGDKYIRAAIHSAKSVLKYCPNLPIHLFANWQQYDYRFDLTPYPFTSVSTIEKPHRRSKVDYMSQTPFDYTLYLDSDTSLNTDIGEMFQILDRFDIALAHAHRRNGMTSLYSWRLNLPMAYPQYNSGVLLYRKTMEVMKFMEDWRDQFGESGFQMDQITLRELLWLSDLRIATLPPEYNVRFIKNHFLWYKTEARTKIFHLQMYHDGPFWFIKNWSKKIGRAVLLRLGMNPSKLKNLLTK